MPDNSVIFNQGKCRIKKHPLGFVQLCEEQGMTCTMYQFIKDDQSVWISRHGSKGACSIDGCYMDKRGMKRIKWVTIITDTGIASDHDMHIN